MHCGNRHYPNDLNYSLIKKQSGKEERKKEKDHIIN